MDPSQIPDIESVVSGLNRKRNDDVGSDLELVKSSSSEKTLLPTSNGPLSTKYTMNGTRRGKVIIFNHFTFYDKNGKTRLKPRDGSDNDVKKLQDTLPKLGFCLEDIKVFPDCNEEQMFEVFTKCACLCKSRHTGWMGTTVSFVLLACDINRFGTFIYCCKN